MGTEIATFDTMARMADAMAKSKLFGVKTPDEALALMMVAQAEGQHPATIVQDYDIIQGRAARKTHSVLARFQQAGGKVEWHELSDTKADATFSHPQGVARIAWTIDQAKRIGLTNKDNWKNYPRAMLRARCIAEGVRAAYPAAIGGMLVTEEVQDLPARDMGAAVVVSEQQAIDLDSILMEIDGINDLDTLRSKRAQWGQQCAAAKATDMWSQIKAATEVRAAELKTTDVEPEA